ERCAGGASFARSGRRMLAPVTDHPVRLVVSDDLHRSRLTVFFRLLLAIPHIFWAGLIGTATGIAVLIDWFFLLVRARSPQGIHEFVAGYVRYLAHIEAYLFLAANPFPGFYPFDEGPYPVDLEIGPPERQNRWITF